MGGAALLPNEIAEALARGAIILTGNQRAARTLQHAFDLHNRALGLVSWEPPAILAWDAWTARLWQQLLIDGHTARLLLNRAQEHTLWRSIVSTDTTQKDTERRSLRTPDSLAEMAADAWSRLCAYRGESRLHALGVSADTRAFQRWASAFEMRCGVEGYRSQAQLESVLEEAVTARHVLLAPGGYVLIGFDGMTPAQAHLTNAIRSTGTTATELQLRAPTGLRTLAAADDAHEELASAARWTRTHLEQHPGARIALIVPGLETRRAEIDRLLRNTLTPEFEDITATQTSAVFEFSLGVSLAGTPLIAAALNLLRWPTQPLPTERVSDLLLSRYFAEGAERLVRAEFDAHEFRRTRRLRPEMSLDGMLREVETAKRIRRLPRLLVSLHAMRRAIKAEGLAAANEYRPHADWAEAMRTLLEAAGWNASPSNPDDSLEFQTRRKWESVLDELATLDFEGIRVTFPAALATVERLAQQTLFAPESRGAPVQVMGPLESAGSTWNGEYDAIWFLRAGDLDWPIRPGANPLLAWHMQRELRMPGVDPARDEEHSRAVTERIASSSSTVVFSYPRESSQGKQRPSAALDRLRLDSVEMHTLVPEAPPRDLLALEAIEDSGSLPPLPDRVMRGGAAVLKLQAACGFRAFAEQRLSATTLDFPKPGMDARERGSAVHVALEHFWKEVKSQGALKALSTADRHAILSRAIELAFSKITASGDFAWDIAYMGIQRERLLGLLDTWLLTEMQRGVPFTVKMSETELTDVHIGPLRLTLRVDRIDQTEFGDVILDYKTGAASPGSWLTERPDEPQLPLYAILSNATQLAGVAFGQVRAGKDMALRGYQTETGVLLKAANFKDAANLEDQLSVWRGVLTALAADFHAGDVRVRPKRHPGTCEFCSQRLLCRLDISLLAEDSGDLDTGDRDGGTEAEEGSNVG